MSFVNSYYLNQSPQPAKESLDQILHITDLYGRIGIDYVRNQGSHGPGLSTVRKDMMKQSDANTNGSHETELFTRRMFEGIGRSPGVRFLGRCALHLKDDKWGIVASESIGLRGETKWLVIRLPDGKLLDGPVSDFRMATPEEEDSIKSRFS